MLPDAETLRNLVPARAGRSMPRFAALHGAGRLRRQSCSGRMCRAPYEARRQRRDRGRYRLAAAAAARSWRGTGREYDFLGEEMAGHEQEEFHARLHPRKACGAWITGRHQQLRRRRAVFRGLARAPDHCPELGLVYDPVRGRCFTAQRGQGAWLNGLSLGTRAALELPLSRCIAVDFKRLAASLAARLGASPPYGSQRSFGASSLDWRNPLAGAKRLFGNAPPSAIGYLRTYPAVWPGFWGQCHGSLRKCESLA